MKKVSLQTRIIVPVVLLVLLVVALNTAISYANFRQAMTESRQGELMGQAQNAAQVFEVWLDGAIRQVEQSSLRLVYREVLKQKSEAAVQVANNELARQIKEEKAFERMSLAGADGLFVASSEPASVGKTKVDTREYFKKSMQGAAAVSEVLISRTTNKPTFIISAPLRDQGKVLGVMVTAVNLGFLTERFVDTVKVGKTGYVVIFDGKGQLLAHPDKAKVLQEDLTKTAYGQALLAQKKGLTSFTQDGKEWMASLQPCGGGLDWTMATVIQADEVLASVYHTRNLNLIVAGGGVLLLVAVLFFLGRSVTRPLNRASLALSAGAEQVAAAAAEVSSAAQSLAAGASQQAASLEETSASLEEMSSMIKGTADHAAQADGITSQAGQSMQQASGSMDEMALAMTQIAEAGAQINKVVKSIDEIAFQTNLLALNAAVEAARAGEAGAGFAVVADEVRNLALRAAQAAKNTQDLIEQTVQRIHQGNTLVKATQEGFQGLSRSTGEVTGLIGQIATASREQAQGVEQVTTAMSQMDRVVQQTAAHAEQSAAASEELKAQAASLHDSVEQIKVLIQGERG
ncbi:MAG: methyl-accepting chemotaxis protein [Desulfarculus sp.]|nr:methyl-accepting chemotaxis protein [Desulfarculus sp.]